ncbi:hypothetical protein K7432_016894 [Basidiobolus ranarum]|uniref:Uncharacterized protein n=1 Tax=Basidiobolus ranarum TaxID=34480 RepID=A0ABR2VL16_9FUNG
MEKERKKWLLEKNSGDKESESFIHKISDLEQTIRKLRADVKNEQIASEKQRNEMTDRIEAVNRELGAAKAKSDLLTAEHHLKQERWSSEKKDMLHQIKELQLKLNNAEAVVKTNEEFQNTTQQGNSKMEEKFQKLKEKLVKSLTLASDSQTQLKEKAASWNDERLQLETQIKSLEKKVNEKTSKSSDLIQKRQAKHRGATKVSQDPQSEESSEDDIISIVTKPISKRQKPAPVVQESAIVEELTDSEPEEKPVKKNNKRIASESKQTDEPKKPAKKQALKAVAQAEEPAPVPSPKRSRKKPTKAAIEIVPQQDEEKTSQSVVSEITANESKKASPSKFGRKKASPTISMNTSIDSEDLTSFDEPAKKVITVKKPMERKKKSAIEDSSAIKASETSEPEEKSPPQAANLKKKISFNRKRQSLATNTDIPDEPAVKKKRKIALGKNRQSIGLNTSTETTGLELPPQPSNISAAARSRYSIAPNIGKGPGSLRNGSGNHRISILGSAGNPKQNGLPPLPGNGRNALNLPRKLGQMKSAESLESIKSSFSISNILNK